jgi:hypothetical protein
LRLVLRKAQAQVGDIALLHADESEALTHPYLARAWAKRGADLRVPAPGQSKKIAMLGARDAATGELLVVTSKTKRSADFVSLLEEIDRVHGPSPGAAQKPVVIVLDNGPTIGKATKKAKAAPLRSYISASGDRISRYVCGIVELIRTERRSVVARIEPSGFMYARAFSHLTESFGIPESARF